MTKTTNINIRIEPEVKREEENIFSNFGITVTDAINIFLCKSIMEGAFHFTIKQQNHNSETESSIKEVLNIMSGKSNQKLTTLLKNYLKT